MADDVRAFGKQLLPLVGPANVSYTPGVVLHIWHGDRANRDYTHRCEARDPGPGLHPCMCTARAPRAPPYTLYTLCRYEILKSNAYDPVRDVRVNEQARLAACNQSLQPHAPRPQPRVSRLQPCVPSL